MAAAPDPLAGLPSLADLRSEADRGETFGQLKDWVRSLSRQEGGIACAGRHLGLEHRRAVLHFLGREAQGGMRQKRARELLATLTDVQEFAGDAESEERAEEAADGSPASSAADSRASGDNQREEGPASDGDLPSAAELEDPQADGRELFQRLRAWVRAERQAGRLEAAGAALGPNYRRSVFEFLCAFSQKKTVFRGQAGEMLQRLASLPAWRQGGAADSAAVASALGDSPNGDGGQRDAPEEGPARASLPSQATLEDPKGNAEESLRCLAAWVEAGRRSGRLAAEARGLEPGHRQAIIAFLCRDRRSPAVPSAARKSSWPLRASPKMSLSVERHASDTKASGVSPEGYYVLQSLAELGEPFCEDIAADQSALSRALAQMPRAG